VLDTKDVTDVFAEVAERYDAVVLDVPPLLNVSYAGQVLREVDGAVIVGAAGTAVNHLTELRDRLALLDVRVIGFIYNRGPLRPERTASIAALHYDLGGKRAPLGRRSRRRKPPVPAGTVDTTSSVGTGNGAVAGAPQPSREPR
jgi:Mrp family chromosome partitioning ATPase